MRNQQCFHHPSRSLSLKLLVCRSFVPAFWVAKKMSEASKKPKQQHFQRFLARCLGTFFWLLATFSDFILVESNLSFLVLNFLQAETEKIELCCFDHEAAITQAPADFNPHFNRHHVTHWCWILGWISISIFSSLQLIHRAASNCLALTFFWIATWRALTGRIWIFKNGGSWKLNTLAEVWET